MSLSRFCYTLLSIILVGILLDQLQTFLIPLVFSFALWFVIRKLRNTINKYIKIPFWLGSALASILIILVLVLFSQLLTTQVKGFMEKDNLDKYSNNFEKIGAEITDLVGYEALQNGLEQLRSLDFAGAAQGLIGVLSNLLGNGFMVILYLLFLLLEENSFKSKLKAVYKEPKRLASVTDTIRQIAKSIESYITLKTIVSLITGLASYLALRLLGVDFPVFWAMLIFLLNYIPTVGSLVGTVFPALMALIQFQDFSIFFSVLVIIGIIQLIVGNFVEPKIMGESLNISPLVVIVSLTLWGLIWGVIGMVLSVPIMVILIIIFSKIPSTKNIAIFLSGNGKV